LDDVRPNLVLNFRLFALKGFWLVFGIGKRFIVDKDFALGVGLSEKVVTSEGGLGVPDNVSEGIELAIVHLMVFSELDDHWFADALELLLLILSLIDLAEGTLGKGLPHLVSSVEDEAVEVVNNLHIAMLAEHFLYHHLLFEFFLHL